MIPAFIREGRTLITKASVGEWTFLISCGIMFDYV